MIFRAVLAALCGDKTASAVLTTLWTAFLPAWVVLPHQTVMPVPRMFFTSSLQAWVRRRLILSCPVTWPTDLHRQPLKPIFPQTLRPHWLLCSELLSRSLNNSMIFCKTSLEMLTFNVSNYKLFSLSILFFYCLYWFYFFWCPDFGQLHYFWRALQIKLSWELSWEMIGK